MTSLQIWQVTRQPKTVSPMLKRIIVRGGRQRPATNSPVTLSHIEQTSARTKRIVLVHEKYADRGMNPTAGNVISYFRRNF